MLEYAVFNIFAKIYLYLCGEISSTKLNLALGEFNNIHKIEKIISEDISETIEKVNDIVHNKKNDDNNVQYLVDLLISIDVIFQTQVELRIENYKGPLNSDLQDKILLYPKRQTKTNRKSGSYPSITSNLTSIIPIVLKENCKYCIENYYISNTDDFIRVAFVPFPLLENEQESNEKFIISMKDAIENGNNIIVSNEYNGSEELDNKVYDLLINYPDIKFVCCPSHLDSNNFNKTKIYYNNENTIEDTIYKKHSPYTEKGKVAEKINYDDEVKFVLFHIENIGIFTIVICKDAFSDYVKAIVNEAQVDIIIIMAKTYNYSKFISTLKMFASNKRVALLCNSCICSKKLNSSGIIVYYDKDMGANNENEVYELIKNKCEFKCDEFCRCYFQFDIIYNTRNLIINKNYIHILG